MAVMVRVTTEYVDTDTGEVLQAGRAEGTGIPYDKFDFTTREGILTPLDDLETILIKAGHDSMTEATEKYMESAMMAKKKTERVRKVGIDAKIGRFWVWVEGDLVDTINSRERLVDFKITESMLHLNAHMSYRETVDEMNRSLDRHEGERLAYRTWPDRIIRLGEQSDKVMDSLCSEILSQSGFDPVTVLPSSARCVAFLDAEEAEKDGDGVHCIEPDVQTRIDKYNSLDSHKNCPLTPEIVNAEMQQVEDLSCTIVISVDDACTKSQKTTHDKKGKTGSSASSDSKQSKADENDAKFRESYPEYLEDDTSGAPGDDYSEAEKAADLEEAAAEADKEDEKQEKLEKEGKKQGKGRPKKKKSSKKTAKRIWHTNAQVIDCSTGKIYRFHARGKLNAMRQILAFLLKNNMLKGKNIIFLTDGADDIRQMISKHFAFLKYRLIVDWFHVRKKCNEHASMALKCKLSEKRAIKRELFVRLWAGQTDYAIEYLNSLDVEKNDERFDDFIGYLTRKKPYIPCYALRRMLGLHNSSQFVEKTNDLIVSARQKHNGMSWSWDGGCASASLRALELNGELRNFLRSGSIAFEPVEPSSAKNSVGSKAA